MRFFFKSLDISKIARHHFQRSFEKSKFLEGGYHAHCATFNLTHRWITFLWQALPAKLRPTLLELLIGAMICGSGHLTDALLEHLLQGYRARFLFLARLGKTVDLVAVKNPHAENRRLGH